MPFDTTTPQQSLHIEAYVCTDRGASVAQAVFEANGGTRGTAHGGGLSGAARVSTDLSHCDLILTELGNIPVEMACECLAEITQNGAHVVVLGEQSDLETYRALRKAGACEYFDLSASAMDILSLSRPAPSAPIAQAPAVAPVQKTTSIGVVGSNGGVGASLLAQNLAFFAAAAKGANLRTALVDADLRFGSQAIDLDRDQTAGLFDALKSPSRVDATFIGATMDHLTERLALYSNQVRFGQDHTRFEDGFASLFRALNEEFETLIVDLPRTMIHQRPEVLAELDVLILVIPAGFTGVHTATQLIDQMKSQFPDLRILPVLSQVRRDAALSSRDVTKTIHMPLAATLPSCATQLVRAHRAAQPMVQHQPKSAYAASIRTLWSTATAQKAAVQKPAKLSLFKRLLG